MRKRWCGGLAIMVLTALPVLLLSPFPTQDGPSHLYGASLLRHLGDSQFPSINQAFAYSPSALSTWTVHGMLSLLLGLVAPFWAEKLVVLAFVGWIFSLFIFGVDDEEAVFFPLCALPLFVMSFVLRMGFYSFCLSLPLALHAVTLWTGGEMGTRTRRLVLAACCLALLPLLHLMTTGWALALMGACSIGTLVAGRGNVRELAMLALASLALLAVVGGYPDSSLPYAWDPFAERLAGLMAGGAFVGEGRDALWWSALPSVALLALGALWLRDELSRGLWQRRAAVRPVLALLLALLLALFAPEEGAGGAYIGVRCSLLFFLLLLFRLGTWRLPARLDAVLSLVFLLFSLVHLSRLYTSLKPASAAEREIAASAARLRDHTTALVVVAGEWMGAANPTLATQIRPLLHAGDLLGVGEDRTILSFYQGEIPYFPVNFRREATPFGVLFDRALYGWDAPGVRWNAVPTWQGGVEYVGVWDEEYLLSAPSEGAGFRAAMCGHYEELYRSDSWPWAIYHLRGGEEGAHPLPRFCP